MPPYAGRYGTTLRHAHFLCSHCACMHARQACLKEHGTCPFTKAPLSWEQCTVLTLHNIERFRSRIK